MRKYFNTEGACSPKRHYMVKLNNRLRQIKEQYVDMGKYFVINRGRQYGKTTTLRALAEYLSEEYMVLSLDFQMISSANFADEDSFSRAIIRQISRAIRDQKELREVFDALQEKIENGKSGGTIDRLFDACSEMCRISTKPVVMMIDEADSASNNQVFIEFLAVLRGYYLSKDSTPTFQSVILAGVYDIKNLKQKLRPDCEHRYNSPWNIAANFDISMSLSADEIAGMLADYDADFHTGMDERAVADKIYAYTSGYPYLVSFICKLLDETISLREDFSDRRKLWSREGICEAVKIILNSRVTLFDSMTHQLYEYPEMKQMLYQILFQGLRVPYNEQNPVIGLASMFGYIVNCRGTVQVANRIFETCLYNLFISEEVLTNAIYDRSQENPSQFLTNGQLDMDRVVAKFVEYFTDIYGENDEKFVEEYGRKFFLLYLKPIINGTGNYYIEAQTRDARRTDVIVDYRGEQFVIEMKIWRGNEYNERGEQQLADYLEYYHLTKGYMVSFNFNKNKTPGVRTITVGDKTIVEAVV